MLIDNKSSSPSHPFYYTSITAHIYIYFHAPMSTSRSNCRYFSVHNCLIWETAMQVGVAVSTEQFSPYSISAWATLLLAVKIWINAAMIKLFILHRIYLNKILQSVDIIFVTLFKYWYIDDILWIYFNKAFGTPIVSCICNCFYLFLRLDNVFEFS